MKREELENWLVKTGWKIDRWGHYHKEVAVTNTISGEKFKREYRIKMQATSMRIERKVAGWVKVNGDYYKNLTLEDNNLKLSNGSKISGG